MGLTVAGLCESRANANPCGNPVLPSSGASIGFSSTRISFLPRHMLQTASLHRHAKSPASRRSVDSSFNLFVHVIARLKRRQTHAPHPEKQLVSCREHGTSVWEPWTDVVRCFKDGPWKLEASVVRTLTLFISTSVNQARGTYLSIPLTVGFQSSNEQLLSGLLLINFWLLKSEAVSLCISTAVRSMVSL